MLGKIKVINGIFKGLESYDEYFDINMQSDKSSAITFRVDQRNKITVDFADVEIKEKKEKYVIYIEVGNVISEIIGIFDLTYEEMKEKSLKIYKDRYISISENGYIRTRNPNNSNVITHELSKLKFQLCGKEISGNDLKKVLDGL